MSRVRVKICCISSIAEAAMAVEEGADALGLVGPMPTGPGILDDARAAEIAAATPPPVDPILLTAEEEAGAIAAHAARAGVRTVQIVRHVPARELARLRAAEPALRLIQAVHVEGPEARRIAAAYHAHADALLLDSGRPALMELGGTGRPHDWSVSAEIVAESPVPVFLAGGLSPRNVGEAIAQVRPWGVDLCTGVRRADRSLDRDLLRAFMAAVAAAPAPRIGG